MIQVLLDTTVFRDDPLRRKAAFTLVCRLVELGKLRLHISDVTRREFVTQQEEQLKKGLRKLGNVYQEMWLKIPNKELFGGLESEIQKLRMNQHTIEDEFSSWLQEWNVEVHRVADHHGKLVVDKYFSGQAPFSQIKSRNDFPDAFILEAVSDLVQKFVVLKVITNDALLSSAVSTLNGVSVEKSLHDFVKSLSLDKLVHHTECLNWILGILDADVNETAKLMSPPIMDGIEQSGCMPFPEEIEATIVSIGELRDFNLNTIKFEDYGDGLFVVPFTTNTRCYVSFFMPKSQYWASETESLLRNITDWNDYVFQVAEFHNFAVTGTLRFQIRENALDGSIDRIKRVDQIAEIAEIGVDEILSIEIVE